MNIKLRNLTSCIALVAALAFSVSAHAITYQFTQADNSMGGSNTNNVPSFGTVDVTNFASDLRIQINLSPNVFVSPNDMSGSQAIAFSLATSGLAISGTSGGPAPLTSPFFQVAGALLQLSV